MNLKETYNKIAQHWHVDHGRGADTWWIEGTDAFIACLKPGDLVLDLGCGPGVKTKYLIEKGLRVIGIDFSEQMIEIAKKEVPLGEFHIMDFKDVKELGRNFDAVFAQAALLHAQKNEMPDIIKDLASVIKKDGHFYIAVKEKGEHADEEIVTEYDYGYEYKRFFSYYTQNEIEVYLSQNGFKIVYSDIWKNAMGKSKWVQVIGKKEA